MGQLLAIQIASAIAMKSPDEKRSLLVGLGLELGGKGREVGAEEVAEVVDVALRCL